MTTERLVLSRPTRDDLADLHALYRDPAVWEHFPSGRHEHPGHTEELLAVVDAQWAAGGLGTWTARWGGDPVRSGAAREFGAPGGLVGVGGCSLRSGAAWNLGYRLARRWWGRGLAQEVIAAARGAAGRVRPDLPVTAHLLEHNAGSRRAAERAGLELVWRGPDAGNPDPAAVRLVYADRPVDPAVLEQLVERS